jgi:hypothetical protein
MPVPGVDRTTDGEGAGEMPSTGGTPPRTGPRTAAAGSGSTAGWNLRTPREPAGVHYRVLYFFHGAIAAVVAHGIVKERAVPPKEIDRAIERKRRFEANPAKHGREESTK